MRNNANPYLKLTVGLLAALLLVVPVPRVGAADAQPIEGITMSPVNKHYDLKTGEQVNDTLLVLNHGKTDYDFALVTRGYDVESETYTALTDKLSNPMADVGQWVSFSQTTYHLKAGDNVTVPFTVTVPDKVTPGAHTGIIYAEIQPKETTGIAIKKSVGLVLYANIGGEYKQAGAVDSVTIPFYQPSLPLHTSTRFVNTGTAYYEASETVTVTDLFGNKLAGQSKDFTVLPDKPRRIDIDQSNLGSVGLYKVSVLTKVLGSEKTVEGYVLVVPLWLLIGMPLLILLVIFYTFARPGRRQVQFRKPTR